MKRQQKNSAFIGIALSLFLLGFTFCAAHAAEHTCTNSIGMEFILVPAGTFSMGAGKSCENALAAELPVHRVTISKAFYLGTFEVTQAQWVAVMGSNPSSFKGESNPVEQVSWDDIQLFIQRLNQKEGHQRYRLPTEAEWEYAARAGTGSSYSFGDDASLLERHAWYEDNADQTTHPVGRKEPNPWGFYDMHGNVWEWVQDWHDDYHSDSVTDPVGPATGTVRALRGGSWYFSARHCRSSYRFNYTPDDRREHTGFRLALSLEQ